MPGPLSGIITSDRALSCNLLALRAFSTLGDRLVLIGSAETGRARGKSRPARSNGRNDLIMYIKPYSRGGNKDEGMKINSLSGHESVGIMPQGATACAVHGPTNGLFFTDGRRRGPESRAIGGLNC
ncbi:hypothetical protein D3C73_1421510 [compost metagenome]